MLFVSISVLPYACSHQSYGTAAPLLRFTIRRTHAGLPGHGCVKNDTVLALFASVGVDTSAAVAHA